MSSSRWYTLPLVLGNHIDIKNFAFLQDGYIASILNFIIFFAFGLSLIVGAELSHIGSDEDLIQLNLDPWHIKLVLVVYMLVACVLVFVLYKLRSKGLHKTRETGITRKIIHGIQGKFPLVGAVCCYVPILVLDLLSFVAHAECIAYIYNCGNKKIWEFVGIFTFSMTHTVFASCLLALAVIQSRKASSGCIVAVRHMLMFVLASTAVILVFTWTHDLNPYHEHVYQAHKSRASAYNLTMLNCGPAEVVIVREEELNTTIICLTGGTQQLSFLREVAAPLLCPANVIFCVFMILVIGRVFIALTISVDENGDMTTTNRNDATYIPVTLQGSISSDEDDVRDEQWTHSSTQRKGTKHTRNGGDQEAHGQEEAPLLNGHQRRPHSACSTNSGFDEAIPNTGTYGSTIRATPEDPSHYQELQPRRGTMMTSSQTDLRASQNSERGWLIGGILLALLINLVILSLLLMFYYHSSVPGFAYTSFSCKTSFILISFVWICRVWKQCEAQASKFQPFCALEMLALCSTVGPVLYALMSAIAGFGMLFPTEGTIPSRANSIAVPVVEIIQEVLEIIFTMLQTTYMIHMPRIEIQPGSACSKHSVKSLSVLLGLSTLCVWGVDSFGAVMNLERVDFVQTHFYGVSQWWTIFRVILPLGLFYRLTAFFIFMGIALKQ